jgi:hypothetical protein
MGEDKTAQEVAADAQARAAADLAKRAKEHKARAKLAQKQAATTKAQVNLNRVLDKPSGPNRPNNN